MATAEHRTLKYPEQGQWAWQTALSGFSGVGFLHYQVLLAKQAVFPRISKIDLSFIAPILQSKLEQIINAVLPDPIDAFRSFVPKIACIEIATEKQIEAHFIAIGGF